MIPSVFFSSQDYDAMVTRLAGKHGHHFAAGATANARNRDLPIIDPGKDPSAHWENDPPRDSIGCRTRAAP